MLSFDLSCHLKCSLFCIKTKHTIILYYIIVKQLEFVQSLASPAYLHYLATSGILYQSTFLDFLRYLRYWKQPQYAKYLLYPHCLYFLDLLVPPSSDPTSSVDDGKDGDGKGDSGEAFRREMAQVPFRNFVHEQQFYSWQFRSKHLYGSSKDDRGEESKEGSSDTGG